MVEPRFPEICTETEDELAEIEELIVVAYEEMSLRDRDCNLYARASEIKSART